MNSIPNTDDDSKPLDLHADELDVNERAIVDRALEIYRNLQRTQSAGESGSGCSCSSVEQEKP